MNNGGGGLATSLFGGLGFGSKPNEPAKTGLFGSPSLFGAPVTSPNTTSLGAQAQQQKSPFGSILRGATFNANTGQPVGGLFGSNNSTPPASNAPATGGGLFSSAAASNQSQGGSLFNSFKTPQKTGFGAPATSFGASPAFGSAPAFGTSSFGAAPAFGTSSRTLTFVLIRTSYDFKYFFLKLKSFWSECGFFDDDKWWFRSSSCFWRWYGHYFWSFSCEPVKVKSNFFFLFVL